MEDRFEMELTTKNGAGKVTARSVVSDLSKLDCAILQKRLAEGQTNAIQDQIDNLLK